MSNFYPIVGRTDNYKLLPPFDGLNKDTTMTVVGTMLLADYDSADIDIFKTVYERNGLTEQDFRNDIDNNVMLVTLKLNTGKEYIPSSYLYVESPDKRTFVYNRKAFIIDLGQLPVMEDVESLKTELVDTIVRTLGIEPFIKDVVISDDVYVDDEENSLRLANRSVSRVDNFTSVGRVSDLMAEVSKKDEIIRQLKDIIKTLDAP